MRQATISYNFVLKSMFVMAALVSSFGTSFADSRESKITIRLLKLAPKSTIGYRIKNNTKRNAVFIKSRVPTKSGVIRDKLFSFDSENTRFNGTTPSAVDRAVDEMKFFVISPGEEIEIAVNLSEYYNNLESATVVFVDSYDQVGFYREPESDFSPEKFDLLHVVSNKLSL